MHFETITKLLDLPNVIVVGSLDCGDGHLHLVVALSDNADTPICSWCGAVHASVHSKGQMRVEDLPVHGLVMSKRGFPDGHYLGKPVTMKGQYFPGGRTLIDVEISGERAAQIDMN